MDNPIAMFGHTEYKTNPHIKKETEFVHVFDKEKLEYIETLIKEEKEVVEIPKIKHLANPEDIL